MFRQMRRKKQVLTKEDCELVLERGTSGVLAVQGDGGYPYAVPLSYVYTGGKIVFHCAKQGHKLDAIARHDKASFCVIDRDDVVPENYTTRYRSVIAFGRVRVVEDPEACRRLATVLAEKYNPGHPAAHSSAIEGELAHLCIFTLEIEHLCGKEGLELLQEREN